MRASVVLSVYEESTNEFIPRTINPEHILYYQPLSGRSMGREVEAKSEVFMSYPDYHGDRCLWVRQESVAIRRLVNGELP